MRNLLRAALFASIVTASATATAGSLVDLAVVDRDTGETLRTYSDHGKTYVAGTPGHRYSVRLANRSGGRVLTVLSVDGVNAVSGQTASAEQTGYVLDAWESTEISGWRKNLDEVAQFNFTALPDSYAARTGRPANVGVIGVAVFTERVSRWREADRMAEAARPSPAPSADASSAPAQAARPAGRADSNTLAAEPEAKAGGSARRQERLGTGHGAREYAHVESTTFERASSRPAETVAIWYDSYPNLVAQGIVPRPIARAEPRPFPGAFVPDPAPR